MTLAELRALRPAWREPALLDPAGAVDQFAETLRRGVNLAELTDTDLATLFAAAVLVGSSAPAEAAAFAEDVAHEYVARDGRYRASAPTALAWLRRNDRVAATYLVGRLFCANGKRLADLYCLPEDAAPVSDSGGYRLLIVPTRRGRLAEVGVRPSAATPDRGAAWWYISDDDVWDLGCKCCRRPEGGVRAADFLDDDQHSVYSVVLA